MSSNESSENHQPRFPAVGDGSGIRNDDLFYKQEIQLALRNRGMPLECLSHDITPGGLHYLLVHFDIPEVDPAGWRLQVGGKVSRPLSLTLDEIKARPAVKLAVTMECAGNGRALLNPRPISQPWLVEAIGTAEWTGAPLKGILEDAHLDADAVELLFTGVDEGVQGEELQYYQRSLSREAALREEALLAYEMNGQPLPPQHGYPLRLIVPGWYGMTSVKWLSRIEALDEPFEGYQMKAYRYCQTEEDPGSPVNRIRVRALMIPPGVPDFLTRVRLVKAGPVLLRGRAWAGAAPVARVEVSVDGGVNWAEAELEKPVSPLAWRAWSFHWEAQTGSRTLCVRATGEDGHTQPLDEPWNFYGMGNNMVQRVDVIVE